MRGTPATSANVDARLSPRPVRRCSGATQGSGWRCPRCTESKWSARAAGHALGVPERPFQRRCPNRRASSREGGLHHARRFDVARFPTLRRCEDLLAPVLRRPRPSGADGTAPVRAGRAPVCRAGTPPVAVDEAGARVDGPGRCRTRAARGRRRGTVRRATRASCRKRALLTGLRPRAPCSTGPSRLHECRFWSPDGPGCWPKAREPGERVAAKSQLTRSRTSGGLDRTAGRVRRRHCMNPLPAQHVRIREVVREHRNRVARLRQRATAACGRVPGEQGRFRRYRWRVRSSRVGPRRERTATAVRRLRWTANVYCVQSRTQTWAAVSSFWVVANVEVPDGELLRHRAARSRRPLPGARFACTGGRG
jgi:hypothetical protein